MEDRGMTREERSSVKHTIDSVRVRCDQLKQNLADLDAALPRQPDKAGVAAERWLQLAEVISKQIRSVGEEVLPLLDHWVFEPVHPGPIDQPARIPELLRTKMREEQEQNDDKLRSEISQSGKDVPLEALQEREAAVSKAVARLSSALGESYALESISRKRTQVSERISSSASKKTEVSNGVSLLRVLKRNDRQGVRLEETFDERS